MKSSHRLFKNSIGQSSLDNSSHKESPIRSLLITVKKEMKKSSHRTSLKSTIHADLVMRCMVLG